MATTAYEHDADGKQNYICRTYKKIIVRNFAYFKCVILFDLTFHIFVRLINNCSLVKVYIVGILAMAYYILNNDNFKLLTPHFN